MSRMTAARPITDDRTTSPIHDSDLPGAPRAALSAPFSVFGGKSAIAPLIWEALGDPAVYIESFFASGATLLARPATQRHREIVNDIDGYIANFWRAVQQRPGAVARWANWPSNEIDLQARHRWLCDAKRKRRFVARMRRDPDYCSAKIAGWWVWGISQWIGAGWCEGEWHGDGDARNWGSGMDGSHRQRSCPGGIFAASRRGRLRTVFESLSKRLEGVSVLCGDWSRVVTRSNLSHFPVGIFLDPPYSHDSGRDIDIYAHEMVSTNEVRERAFELGKDDRVRVVLAGQEGEYRLPGWKVVAWTRGAGYARIDRAVADRAAERLWLSPGCLLTPEIRRHIRTWWRRSDAADVRPATAKSRPDRKPGRWPEQAPHNQDRRTGGLGARARARGRPRATSDTRRYK
ncbi:MAG: DNA adenine methylase [Phycisphaerales bacterium]|nr:DNA adenine methylase [Phycisphaerales bacterium]MCB9864875.1 DNA adenine methylase [Phycisphaerales bacterium]